MRLVDKIRLLAEYAPLLSIAQEIAGEKDPYKKVLLAFQALDFLSDKTDTIVDDELVLHARAVLSTDEGRAAFNAAVEAISALLRRAGE